MRCKKGVEPVLVAVGLLIASTQMGHAMSEHAAAVADGHLLAQRECGSCHATARTGKSPRPDAPLFRHILSRYRAGVLEQELVEGIKLGHPDMPLFRLNPKSVDDLIAYLKSIQVHRHRSVMPRPKPD